MKSINRVTLAGYLGNDPDSRIFESGDMRTSFSLATSESWKDDAGQTQERTQWHRVNVANQGLAKIANEYLRKGSPVLVEGQLEYRDYQDKEGVKRQMAEVVVRPRNGQIVLLGNKP